MSSCGDLRPQLLFSCHGTKKRNLFRSWYSRLVNRGMQQLFTTRGFVLHHNMAKGPRAKCQPVRGQPVCSATFSLHYRHIPVITHLAILMGSVFMMRWPSLGPISQQCSPEENCPNTWIQGVQPNHGSFLVQESLPYQEKNTMSLGMEQTLRS